jgi:ElaB/YqjD/DUF883 family membrane-anchored ribosome-binding protein
MLKRARDPESDVISHGNAGGLLLKIDKILAMSADEAKKVRLGQLVEKLEELLGQAWSMAGWFEKLKETRSQFDDARREAKQLLGGTDGDSFWQETTHVTSKKPSRLQEKKALDSAIKKAVDRLQTYRGQ